MAYKINLIAYLFLFSLLTLQGYILLWATRAVSRSPASLRRLMGGAVVLAGYDILVDLARNGVYPFFKFLESPVAVLALSLAVLIVLFRPRGILTGLKLAGYFYSLTFFSAGAGMAAQSLTGWPWSGPVAAIVTVLVVGEVGWGIVQDWVWQKTLLVPVELILAGEKFQTTALLDTGNSLRDPLTSAPVIIIDGGLLAESSNAEIRELARSVSVAELGQVSDLLYDSPWASRIRLIPFNSLGRSNGLLIGFRSDSVRVKYGGEMVNISGAVVGIHERPLSEDGSYRALIHPELLNLTQGRF